MKFKPTPIEGSYLVELDPRGDERGFFARAWCARAFAEHGIETPFVQCNLSWTEKKGTLRGLHYQTLDAPEAKLVRCMRGRVFDVVVDVRPRSPTFGAWQGYTLSDDGFPAVYVPPGCAHGFQALEDHVVVLYPVSGYYAPEHERGVRWNDPAFDVAWPLEPILSPKDRAWPDFVRPGEQAT